LAHRRIGPSAHRFIDASAHRLIGSWAETPSPPLPQPPPASPPSSEPPQPPSPLSSRSSARSGSLSPLFPRFPHFETTFYCFESIEWPSSRSDLIASKQSRENDHAGLRSLGVASSFVRLRRAIRSTSGVARAGRTSCASLPPISFSLTSSPFFGRITLWTCVRSVLVRFVRSTHRVWRLDLCCSFALSSFPRGHSNSYYVIANNRPNYTFSGLAPKPSPICLNPVRD